MLVDLQLPEIKAINEKYIYYKEQNKKNAIDFSVNLILSVFP